MNMNEYVHIYPVISYDYTLQHPIWNFYSLSFPPIQTHFLQVTINETPIQKETIQTRPRLGGGCQKSENSEAT